MRITVITGTRAEYGLLKPIISEMIASENITMSLICAGMHLSPEFGETIKEIIDDGINVDYQVEMIPESDTGSGMAEAVGRGISGFSKAFGLIKPDAILILGDRIEVLAACVAAAYMNIAIAHVHGGDTSNGGLDESARHAITKFAHLHFAVTQKSADRIIKMGELPENVYVVGAPGLDSVLHKPLLSREDLVKELDIDLGRYLLIVQHPVTTQIDQAASQMRETVESVLSTGCHGIFIYPNCDAGGRKIIQVLEEYKDHPSVHLIKSASHIVYLSLMKHCEAMLGNSSSAIIEAPSFKTPAINIGIRQKGRECANNLINVSSSREEIMEALDKVMDPEFRSKIQKNPYGEGFAGKKIVKILENIAQINIQKKINY